MDKTTFDIRKAITYPISLPHEEDAAGELNVFHYMKENAARYAAGGVLTLMNTQRDHLRYEVPDLVFEALAGR